MNKCIGDSLLLLLIIVGLFLALCSQVAAQTFRVLHNFIGADGYYALGGLILSSNTLYGTSQYGGSSGAGTVFAISTGGMDLTTLHNFTARSVSEGTNSDGANPQGGLVLSGNVLYGTAYHGGASGNGTVFTLNTDGTAFRTLHSFAGFGCAFCPSTNIDGGLPIDTLVFSSNRLYGTTWRGGSLGGGVVFTMDTDGAEFTNLCGFSSGPNNAYNLRSGVILADKLYGTTEFGGASGYGSVYALNLDGTGFTNLYSFTPTARNYTNNDGGYPIAALTVSDNTLFGTTIIGGSGGWGTLFKINIDGTGFTNLHSFAGSSTFVSRGTNSDGTGTAGPLVLKGNTLYGTAWFGGIWDNGTVFCINLDGSGFTRLYNFTATSGSSGVSARGTNTDGANPQSSLVLSGNTLYGTTTVGGSKGMGTIFSITFSPQLAIVPAEGSVVITWPTAYAGFDYTGYTLQFTTNLASPAWTTANPPPPVIINGQYTVTNPILGTQQFFRLSQ